MLSFISQCFNPNKCTNCLIDEHKITHHLDTHKQKPSPLFSSNMPSELTSSTPQEIQQVNQKLKFTTKPCVPEQLYSSMFTKDQLLKMASTHNSDKHIEWSCKYNTQSKKKLAKAGSSFDVREIRKDLLNECF